MEEKVEIIIQHTVTSVYINHIHDNGVRRHGSKTLEY